MTSPEILLVETDHDLRNPADFMVLNKLAKDVLAVPGISKVQGITRPEGTPIAHTSLPYMLSMQQAAQQHYMYFQQERMNDILKQADMLTEAIQITQHMYGLLQQMVSTTHDMVRKTHEMQDITNELARIALRILRISSGRSAATSTGKNTATTFLFAFR